MPIPTTDKSPAWTMFQGVLFIILGAAAIVFPLFATIAVEQIFSGFMLIAGGYALASAFNGREASLTHRIVSILWAVLTLVTGLLLLFKIGAGVLTLTVLLAAYFAAQGIVTIIAAFKFAGTGTMWIMLLSGGVSLVLAWMVFSGFPGSAAWVLGLLFGINMIFTGTFFISMGLTLRERES